MPQLIAVIAALVIGYWLIVNVIFPLIVYFIVPALTILFLLGLVVGGYQSIYHYLRSLRDCVKPERAGSGSSHKIIAGEDPAIKSYFFGKGYRDLQDTIVACWKKNREYADTRFSKMREMFGRSKIAGFFMGSPYLASALASITFGTLWFLPLCLLHIGILAITFSLVYSVCGILLLTDFLRRKYHGIFTACPVCYSKADLPTYVCPQCGAEHKRLIPGAYGIFRRTCLCGYHLPTSFVNGRQKLDARCASCGTPIENGEATPVCLPVIGGPSVGKTCYLFTATRSLMAEAGKQSWSFRFPNKQNEMIFQKMVTSFDQGYLPDKTADVSPRSFNFFLGSKAWALDKLLYFYDVAGEIFGSGDELTRHKYYGYAHGLIILIDPFAISSFRRMTGGDAAAVKASQTPLQDTFDLAIRNLEQHYSLKVNETITQPCAIVFNKVDAGGLEDIIGHRAAQKLMQTQPDKFSTIEQATNYLCIQFLNEYDNGNFVRNIQQRFANYQFFTCSCTGSSQQTANFKPYRVADPLLWLMSKVDKDLRKAIGVAG